MGIAGIGALLLAAVASTSSLGARVAWASGTGTLALTPWCDLSPGEPITFSAGQRREFTVTGACGVAPDAIAVAVVVTMRPATAAGFVAVGPTGAALSTSLVNAVPGETRSNSTLVVLGGGSLSVSSSSAADVRVAVIGQVRPASSAAAGRLERLTPRRLLDTRAGGRPAAGGSVVVRMPTGVPPDAVAAAVTITTTATSAAGTFVAYVGTPDSGAAHLVVDGPNQTRAASVLVPLSAGAFSVMSSAGDHVIVDVTGYVTGASAPTTSSGLFVPIVPRRLADTRLSPPVLYAGGTREWGITGVTSASAVAASLVAIRPPAAGVWRMGPARVASTGTSSLNVDTAGAVVANSQIVGVSTSGLQVSASQTANVVVDLFGWFTGTPLAATLPPPDNFPPRCQRVAIVGDSITVQGRTHLVNEFAARGYQAYVIDAASDRRVPASAGRPISGVLAAGDLKAAYGQFDCWVVALGTNDLWWIWRLVYGSTVSSGSDAAVAWMRAAIGSDTRVWWVNINHWGYPDTTRVFNDRLRVAAAASTRLKVIDWYTLSYGRRSTWFVDNKHLNSTGSAARAKLIVGSLPL